MLGAAGWKRGLPTVLEALDSLQRNEQLGSLSRVIRALAPSWYTQLMPPAPNDSSAARLAADTLGGSQERLKFEICALLEELGRLNPVVLWFDDVHWADPSTTDLIGYVARRLNGMRVMTHRDVQAVGAGSDPSPVSAAHPGTRRTRRMPGDGAALLDDAAVGRYVAAQFPEHTFPDRIRQGDRAANRGESALHGGPAPRSAAASDPPSAERHVGDGRGSDRAGACVSRSRSAA